MSASNKPFIFNGWVDEFNVGAHCGLNIVNEFIAEDDSFELLEEKLIFPYVHKTSGLYYAKMKKKITEE